MLPLTFDRHVLKSPSLMYEDATGRVLRILRAIVERRILPSFEDLENVEPVQLARASERATLSRLEDVENRLDLVSLVAARDGGWTVHIHERVFDYFGFGLPAQAANAFETPTREARKVFALAEFVLRHEYDHVVRPHRSEAEVLAADCAYVVRCRSSEKELYEALMEAFADSTNGLRTAPFLELLHCYEEEEGFDEQAERMIRDHLPGLCELTDNQLTGAFLTMAGVDKLQLLDTAFRRAIDATLPVAPRARHLRTVVALLGSQRRDDVDQLRRLLDRFLERTMVEPFLRELEVDTDGLDPADLEQVFERIVARLAEAMPAEPSGVDLRTAPPPETSLDSPLLIGERAPSGSLRERIEAARQDPLVPRSVIRAIDNNVSNLEGHSKPKYTEFIETLLSVPWGAIRPIEVGPREFSAGLDSTHFGLAEPKELVADFFANLIWRYRDFDDSSLGDWHRTGSAFLFVGPPGVGKTSLAISIASNLGIPYHKVSLGGMRDESALRGHGFTYEGSKPGAVVQGLIKMRSMNGMFILDEADKTEPLTIATLLEILDPEQNHLFHDKYTLTTVDIDLSNCHFILTANTLDTVPAPVIDRCQVVQLDRYSIEEKIEIARRHTMPRLRERHDIPAELIDFEPGHEQEHLRFLIQTYTHEAGVRQLELVLRTLLLRLQRRLLFDEGRERVEITHRLIHRYLDQPAPPATINPDDRIGELLALGVNAERGVGGVIPVQATRIAGSGSDGLSAISMVHATGNLEKVMDESRRVATTAILHCADELGIDPERIGDPVHLHFMGASTRKDGPSAGVAIALTLASLLSAKPLRRDVAATGEIDTQGRVTGVGGLDVKLETAVNAGSRTLLIPRDNLTGPGGVARLPEALRHELQVLEFEEWRSGKEAFDARRHTVQVVAVEHIVQAMEVAVVDRDDLDDVETACIRHGREFAGRGVFDRRCPMTVLVKDPSEVGEGFSDGGLCASCGGCRLLVTAGVDQVGTTLAMSGSSARPVQIEAGADALRSAVEDLAAEISTEPAAVVAPFFALKQARLDELELPGGIKLFANNYLAQGYKLSGSKRVLNRTVCRLLHLDRAALESFPLIGTLDGIYVADLRMVPEKYRLDPGRCEEILQRCLGAWLAAVEGAAAELPPAMRA